MASYGNYEIPNDTIFVTGLPEDTTEEQLGEFFGQIGIIKFDKKNDRPKIWIYKDKTTGKGKGEATITYDDPPTATSAISWFDGKDFRGSTVKIELAQRKSAPPQFSRGRGGGRGGGGFDRGGGQRDERGGGGSSTGRPSGGSGRPGDWVCPTCNNNNFAYRQECNRCRTQKHARRWRSDNEWRSDSSRRPDSGRRTDSDRRSDSGRRSETERRSDNDRRFACRRVR